MCALLRSAEYSALTSPEQHACEVARTEYLEAFDPWSAARRVDPQEESVMTWRETEPYLSVEYLDDDTAELLEFVSAELPFGRARDGNVSAWVLRADQARVITAGDRALILGGVRAAREKFHMAHAVVV